jgi:hypothetical protein
VIQAESQEVLNTLTEYNFQNAFKGVKSAGNDAYSREIVASRPTVSF